MRFDILLLGSLCAISSFPCASSAPHSAHSTEHVSEAKNRIFVLTDIGNEPDDSMSLVRLLVHSNLYQIEGLVAITSFWLPNATLPNMIHDIVDAYGAVQSNLQSHSNTSFPTVDDLKSKIGTGPSVYGMQALHQLEKGANITTGTQMLIDAVDASPSPLYVQLWGGANTLASALWTVNRTRSASELKTFTSKLRAYAISDQDDTGPWIRRNFPNMRYIASRHGFNQYPVAAWIGISSTSVDPGGPDNEIVSQAWLTENIQVGELGKKYPDVAYLMEGDSPSLLYHIPNGLGNPEYPEWGSWGGRYTSNPLDGDAAAQQYGDAVDMAQGVNGEMFLTNHASVWRWRDAFQHEFAARMQWTLSPWSPGSNTTHPPVVLLNGTSGPDALHLNVSGGEKVTLDASDSYSPDGGASLNFTWFQYSGPSSYQSSPSDVPTVNLTDVTGPDASVVRFTVPYGMYDTCVADEDVTEFGQWGEKQKCPILHVVVAVKDTSAAHPITRYRRVLLHVQPYSQKEKR
ncbi:hypothetical protein AA0120_g12708 [Alternaria tenuissima]|nr:hypothetical protein AA0120_g12708 [Alternaria tenuissima]